MPAAMVSRVDEWAAGQPDSPSRAEAIRRLIEHGLTVKSNLTPDFVAEREAIRPLVERGRGRKR
jgi:hypothetical protein